MAPLRLTCPQPLGKSRLRAWGRGALGCWEGRGEEYRGRGRQLHLPTFPVPGLCAQEAPPDPTACP